MRENTILIDEKGSELVVKSLPELPESQDVYGSQFWTSSFLNSLVVGTGNKLPPWWSRERDSVLRSLSVSNEYLSGILFNIQTQMYNINYQIIPKDSTIGAHNVLAEKYNTLLQWSLHNNMELFIKDLLELDNGAFMYIEGNESPSEPLKSMPTGLRTLDSMYCTRTRNSIYPVVYSDPKGGSRYPIHVSRIIYFSQFPSSDWRMNKVGYSSVSRLSMLATHLHDIGIYDLEKLGSLESNRILFASGASARELEDAIKRAEITSGNEGLSRRGKTVYMATRDSGGKVQLLNLKEGESGSDKVSDIEITITLAAMVLGVQPYILLESTQSSSTRNSAKESIKLSNNKLFAWFYKKIVDELTLKFLPQSLQITRPGEDQDIDGTLSRIKLNNALARKNNLALKVTNERVERQGMLQAGEISAIQFEQLELADERLPNGLHISTIFYDKSVDNKYFARLNNPLDFQNNDPEEMIVLINEALTEAVTALNKSVSGNISRQITQVIYALQWLENEYQSLMDDIDVDVVEIDADSVPDLENIDGEINTDNLNNFTEDVADTRERDLENNTQERTQEGENSYQDKSESEDWFLNALRSDEDIEFEYMFTKEPTRRFRQAIRENVRGLWSGEMSKSEFVDNFTSSVSTLLSRTYVNEVKNETGEEIDPADVNTLDAVFDRISDYAEGFADYIVKNAKGVGKLSNVYKRADLWIVMHDEVSNIAKLDTSIDDDREYIWRYGGTMEHCSDCARFANTVKTKLEWDTLREDGYYPQSRSLECSGYKCQCYYEAVN